MANPPSRELWVLLRGLSRSHGHWGNFPELLKQKLVNSEVCCLDLPGNGKYHHLKSPTSVAEITEFVKRDFERVLSARPPLTAERPKSFLVSLSLGSMVAVDWITRYRSDFSGCVLMNTSFSGINAFYDRMQLTALPLLVKIFTETDLYKRESLLWKLTSQVSQPNPEVIEKWVALAHEFPVARANVLKQLLAAFRFRVPQKTPAIPVLVLSSRGDALVNNRCSDTVCEKWGVPGAKHPTAGHDIPLDEPSWVIEQLLHWRNRD